MVPLLVVILAIFPAIAAYVNLQADKRDVHRRRIYFRTRLVTLILWIIIQFAGCIAVGVPLGKVTYDLSPILVRYITVMVIELIFVLVFFIFFTIIAHRYYKRKADP